MNKKTTVSLILILALFSITSFAEVINPFQEDMNAMCEQVNGQTMCLSKNIEQSKLVFTDDIHCYGNKSTFSIENVYLCYSTVKTEKIEKWNLSYWRNTTAEEKAQGLGILTTEIVEKTIFPTQEMDAIVNPELIEGNCLLTSSNEEVNDYEFTCKAKGQKGKYTFLVMADNTLFLISEEKGFSILEFIQNNLVYIILILIIIAVAYSSIKKPTAKKAKKRRR